MIALCSTSCVWDSGGEPNPKRLGFQLWSISRNDLTRVNEIFDYIARYNQLLTIEDETTRELFINSYFYGAAISVNGNIHTIKRDTAYGSTYTVVIKMFEDRWEVMRTGGYGYELTIRPKTANALYSVDMKHIYNNSSDGHGTFDVEVDYIDNNPSISYTGTLVMVDDAESATKPLTVTTEVTSPLSYSYANQFIKGEMTITAYDAMYDTTDKAKVTILHNEYNKIIIECLGNVAGYTYQ